VAVARLRRTIAAAEAVLIATPEYNGSIPGGLKTAVDWASRPFPDNAWRDKPVAVIGASTGIFGAVWAQAELRKSLGIAGARVIDAELAVGSAHDAFLPSGALRDPAHATGLRSVVAALVEARARWVKACESDTSSSPIASSVDGTRRVRGGEERDQRHDQQSPAARAHARATAVASPARR
jgi:chromate reductase